MERNITTSDLQRLALLRHGPAPTRGGGPRLRDRFGYFTPNDWYETLVDQLVTPAMWRLLKAVGLHYPELCVLTVYRWAGEKADGAFSASAS